MSIVGIALVSVDRAMLTAGGLDIAPRHRSVDGHLALLRVSLCPRLPSGRSRRSSDAVAGYTLPEGSASQAWVTSSVGLVTGAPHRFALNGIDPNGRAYLVYEAESNAETTGDARYPIALATPELHRRLN